MEEDRFRDDIDDDEDQPLDFSSKKSSNEPQITASVGHAVNGSAGDRFNGQPWALLPVSGTSGNTSESGVSDLCSNSPQSENGDVPAPPVIQFILTNLNISLINPILFKCSSSNNNRRSSRPQPR